MSSVDTGNVLHQARRRVGDAKGLQFWRALEELADDTSFKHELAAAMPSWTDVLSMDRRHFLQLLAASLAFGGLAACSGPPAAHIVPWITQPSDMLSDAPLFYATALAYGGDVLGVLVESRMGRPSKIEGNPKHPSSLGATGALAQAAVLELWDPDRSSTPRFRGAPSTWEAFAAQLASQPLDASGDGLHVLSGRIVSPTLRSQRDAWLKRYPGAHWYEFEPVMRQQTEEGARQAFGRHVNAVYDLTKADVIVSIAADFLGAMPSKLAYAQAFAQRRKPDKSMSRLYVMESSPSITGSMADHRWPLSSIEIQNFVREIALSLGEEGFLSSDARVRACVDDLTRHQGRCLLVVGESMPPQIHAAVHWLNEKLGSVGQTVSYHEVTNIAVESLSDLNHALLADQVNDLIVLDVNAAYSAFADLDFQTHFTRAKRLIHWGLYLDETAMLAQWHLPASHALESWSDLETESQVASIVQPLIEPLYKTRSVHEFLALLLGSGEQDGLSIVRETWKGLLGEGDTPAWQESLRTGVITMPTMAPSSTAINTLPSLNALTQATGNLELHFLPDPSVWDGRYANNGWLQELPRPLTQLTWGNAAWISPALAKERGLRNGDVVTLQSGGHRVDAPVWIMPGQAHRCIAVHLGYGRRRAGRVGNDVGFNAYLLRTSASPWIALNASMTPTAKHIELASTQQHFDMGNAAPVRSMTLQALLSSPGEVQSGTLPTLYPDQPQGEYAWGMSIDLNACIGCKGCTIACQAENNIPVVGADQVRREREMHWIRVDRYFAGDPDHPSMHHQPVPCMHCEHAPCELVCPVGATVHDSEGLNVQVYNRCVGTRFCSNNCPYKVRRFNFLQFSDTTDELLKLQRNPDVTVRNRGVMEKCTYCIQRIEEAHIVADREQRRIADGDIVTACQAACPTQAIVFGNIRDPDSAVSAAKASSRRYDLLEELNTRPRTSYLANIRNPHPDLDGDA